MKLIVGLGNPGRNYASNRHNIGFMCLNYFARKQGIRFDKKQGRARVGIGKVAGTEVMVAKPQTYMNLSGQSVSRLIRKLGINPDDLLVIHDDLDLPLGKIRIRRGGGSAGHKGVDSIITCLESQDFSRIRIVTPEEKQAITQVIPRVSDAILCLIAEGLMAAMNKYN